ncbi:hypothetical protein [Nitrospirillum sp. BR 11828]|uniref:hypothetical protein n=1 Tax=Nitrospirillum sp. BR 11828 TaxID=3104325 RepID=UPI002ACA70DE|nr:hypothetical protein [Nitrospirillum sp. BR 11828]MDZ5647948.1 hypothetical protein [Nitrospirillum sp. BR 11828]
MSEPTLEQWNLQTMVLMHALLGSISSNFRMVTLRWKIDQWVIDFILEKENTEDFEEISEIMEDYDSLQEKYIKFMSIITVTDAPIRMPEFPERAIFRRKEI